MNKELSSHIIRRGQIRAQLTKFKAYLSQPGNIKDQTQLKLRIEKIQPIWSEFDNVQNKIEEIDNSLEHLKYRDEFVDMYFEIMAQAENQVVSEGSVQKEKIQSTISSDTYQKEQCSLLKLKPLEIPIFSGKYENWSIFKDMYNSMIHTNGSLTKIQKFYYLRNSLSGEASEAIQNLETSDANYDIAWAIITKRYDNQRRVIQAHTKHIYELEFIQKESASKLRFFTNSLNSHIHALQALNHDPYQWGALLLHVITSKIDIATMKEWESEKSGNRLPTIKEMIDFLEKRCEVLESIENAKMLTRRQIDVKYTLGKNTKISTTKKIMSSFVTTQSKMKCFMCQQPHPIYKCTSFLALDVASRLKQVNDLKLCQNCLKNNHVVNQCTSRKCFKCQQSHNSLLHTEDTVVVNKDKVVSSSEPPVISAHTAGSESNMQVLLATAKINVFNALGISAHCRALLDSGSQSNFITNKMVNILGLRRTNVNIPVRGINKSESTIRYKTTASIQSTNATYNKTIEFLVIPQITESLPAGAVGNIQVPHNITLADPSFNKPEKIDILIGADTYWEIMGVGKIKPDILGPYFQETSLGWIVVGKTSNTCHEHLRNTFLLSTYCEQEHSLENKIEAFWKIEECTSHPNLNLEEKMCREHFEKHVYRNIDGRFVVHLPFNDKRSQLGDSYNPALRRFLSLEKRLIRNNNIYDKYKQFMLEYECLGHMKKVNTDSEKLISNDCYYLPHTYVLNESSRTTKLRVVFDGSAKSSSSISLNDVLMKGPKIQPDLFEIALRFRTHKYAFSADITKMYRQIKIDEQDQKYQRILWRKSNEEKINIYQLCTVTYGTVPASYLSVACLDRVADDTDNPKIKEIIRNDFCVDDCLTGADTLTEAIELRDELIKVLKLGGFELRKWTTNHILLFPNPADEDAGILNIDKQNVKTLGLYWEPKRDNYTYSVQSFDLNNPVTKRSVLSSIASLFDPLGLIGPVIVIAKIFMQDLWQTKIGWDDPLNPQLQTEWKNYNKNLSDVKSLIVPRWLGCDKVQVIEVHGFADASIKAYGACIYLRSVSTDGNVKSELICAKSRVAPVKSISIPRLELCAAVLLARLVHAIIPALRINIKSQYLWSDSTVALAWIASESNRWKTFVANRVGEIQTLTNKSEWGHISTDDNPADILSRGCTPLDLKLNSKWWHGPSWLIENTVVPSTYTNNIENNNEINIEIKKTPIIACISNNSVVLNIDKFSSLNKLLHVVAYVLRFKNNSLSAFNNTTKENGVLTVDEIRAATQKIVKIVQKTHFASEIKSLTNNHDVDVKSKIFKLKPFIDTDGILRVGGRLGNATEIHADQRYPVLLPSDKHFSKLIILYEHNKLMHAGPHATLAAVRLKYWPINGRRTARKVIHQCVICFKAKPRSVSPIMGNLPKSRIDQPIKCFENTGVDYAGPFMIKSSNRRNAAMQKSYVCVFVCFATKAMHLELVCGLTTNDFLAAFSRFISRRGLCTNLYSDNATCFVGANNKLEEVKRLMSTDEFKNKLQNFVTNKEMSWHFIPPRAPHFGGLWEAAVRSVKKHLNRHVSLVKLTYDEFYTLLVNTEACLNSRPLTPLSTDPLDLSVITPGHFLIGDSLIALPTPNMCNLSLNLLSRWQMVQRISQQIWKRWSCEYLSELQGRRKWVKSIGPTIQVGDMVIIKESNVPSLKWNLGRVTEVYPGSDGVVRVAMVQTASGPKKRAVRLLCPLPIKQDE